MTLSEWKLKMSDGVSGVLARLTSNADKVSAKFDVLQNKINGLGTMAAGALSVAAIGSFAKSVVDTGSSFDSYEVSLATLLKSGEKASAFFNQIKIDAAKTPFDTESLVLANRALIGAGESAEGSRKVVMDLGNAIAATGGTSEQLKSMAVNLNQIRSIGKASAMDIRQFVFAGIPIYKMLEEAGVKAGKNSEVSYQDLAKALEHARSKAGMFYNGLENMAQSTAGKLSNLEESWTFFKDDMYEKFKPQIKQAIDLAFKFIERLKSTVDWLIRNKEVIGKVAFALGAYLVVSKSVGLALQVKAWWLGMSTSAMVANTLVTEGATVAWERLNIVMGANPIGAIILLVTGLVVALKELYDQNEMLTEQYKKGITDLHKSAYESEIKAIDDLTARLQTLGRTREEALTTALSMEFNATKKTYYDLQSKIAAETDAEKLVGLHKQLNITTAQLEAITAKKNGLSGGSANDLFNNAKGSATAKATDKKLKDGVNKISDTGRSIRNVTVNMKNMVENLNVQTQQINQNAVDIKKHIEELLIRAIQGAEIAAANE